MRRQPLSDAQISEAAKLHSEGWPYKRIAERLGVEWQTVKRAVDPEYRELRNQQARNSARAYRAKVAKNPAGKRDLPTSLDVEADAMARLAEIPPDDRSLTARLMGDPLGARSALAKRFHEGRRA